jgi:hypothetical protein
VTHSATHRKPEKGGLLLVAKRRAQIKAEQKWKQITMVRHPALLLKPNPELDLN